jgi:hypothetical protein
MKLFKTMLFSLCLLLSTAALTYSFWPFGSLKVSNEIKNLKDSQEKNFSDIKAGVQDNKLGINDVKNTMSNVTTELGVIKNNKIDASLQAPITASAGYTQGNSQTSAGRDNKQITKTVTTNDSSVVKAMLSSSATFNLALLAFIRMISVQRSKVENRLMDMMKERDDDYNRLVERNNANYDKLLAAKDYYKSQYMSFLKPASTNGSTDTSDKA